MANNYSVISIGARDAAFFVLTRIGRCEVYRPYLRQHEYWYSISLEIFKIQVTDTYLLVVRVDSFGYILVKCLKVFKCYYASGTVYGCYFAYHQFD